MSAICQPSLSPLVARLSSNEPFPLRRFVVKVSSRKGVQVHHALGRSSCAVAIEFFAPGCAVSVREVRT